jgi:hypothetical protein
LKLLWTLQPRGARRSQHTSEVNNRLFSTVPILGRTCSNAFCYPHIIGTLDLVFAPWIPYFMTLDYWLVIISCWKSAIGEDETACSVSVVSYSKPSRWTAIISWAYLLCNADYGLSGWSKETKIILNLYASFVRHACAVAHRRWRTWLCGNFDAASHAVV